MEAIDKNEYISKIEVVRILQKAYAEGRIKAKDGCVSLLDDINALPAADVQPVRHGRWLPSDSYITTAYGTIHCQICSECGADIMEDDNYDYDLCPVCGARMDGGAENEYLNKDELLKAIDQLPYMVEGEIETTLSGDIKLDNAVNYLYEQYDKALKMDYIKNPLAWALYQTWKHVDKGNGERSE